MMYLHPAGKPINSLAVFKKHGVPAVPQNFNLYRFDHISTQRSSAYSKIIAELFSLPQALPYAALADLREVLFSLVPMSRVRQANRSRWRAWRARVAM